MASSEKLPPPASWRWVVLIAISTAMLGNYYVYDSIGPVADMLVRQLGFTQTQIGALNAVYSIPNIFLVLVGGVLTDRIGVRRMVFWTTVVCLVGSVLTALGSDAAIGS